MRFGLCRMPKSRLVTCTILIFSVFLNATCRPKPEQIAYLSPLDRDQEGFLDPTTYQILSYGHALPWPLPYDTKNLYIPSVINETFDHEQLQKFHAENLELLKTRKPPKGILLSEVLASEPNLLDPNEVRIEALDEKIRAPMEIKRVLFDNACLQARVVGLYRWLLTEATGMKLLHGATLPHEAIGKTGLNPYYFPPKPYYIAEAMIMVQDLDQAMAKKKFRYEIVLEVFSKPAELECKVALHIHRNNLQTSMPYLVVP